jgi:hypothetical protein
MSKRTKTGPSATFKRVLDLLSDYDAEGEPEIAARAMWLFMHAGNRARPEDWDALSVYDKHHWRVLAKVACEALAEHRRRQRH